MSKTSLATVRAVEEIITIYERLRDDWLNPDGWAPREAAAKIKKANLCRLASLAHCLRNWLRKPSAEEEDGFLVLASANLGSLIEGYLLFFLALNTTSYQAKPIVSNRKKRTARPLEKLRFEEIKNYFKGEVWSKREADRWHVFVGQVQYGRNSIHAFNRHSIWSVSEFNKAVQMSLRLLKRMGRQMPPPPSDRLMYAD